MLRSILGDEVPGNGGLDAFGIQVCSRDTITISEEQSPIHITYAKTFPSSSLTFEISFHTTSSNKSQAAFISSSRSHA